MFRVLPHTYMYFLKNILAIRIQSCGRCLIGNFFIFIIQLPTYHTHTHTEIHTNTNMEFLYVFNIYIHTHVCV
jgi:hypothetical protein